MAPSTHQTSYRGFRRPSTPSSLSSHGGSGTSGGSVFRPGFPSRVHPSIPIEGRIPGGESRGSTSETDLYQGSIDVDDSPYSSGDKDGVGLGQSMRHPMRRPFDLAQDDMEEDLEMKVQRYQKQISLLQIERDSLSKQVEYLSLMHGISYQPSSGSSLSSHGGARRSGAASAIGIGSSSYSTSMYQGMDMSGTSATLVSGGDRRPSWAASATTSSGGDQYFVASSTRKMKVCVSTALSAPSSPTDTDGYPSETDPEDGEEDLASMYDEEMETEEEDTIEGDGGNVGDGEDFGKGVGASISSLTLSETRMSSDSPSSLGLFQEDPTPSSTANNSPSVKEDKGNDWDTDDEEEVRRDKNCSLGETPKALVIPSPVIPADLWASIDAVQKDLSYDYDEEEAGIDETEEGGVKEGSPTGGWRSRRRGIKARYLGMCRTLEETSDRIRTMADVLGFRLGSVGRRSPTSSPGGLPDASVLVEQLSEEVISLLAFLQGPQSRSPPVRTWGKEVLGSGLRQRAERAVSLPSWIPMSKMVSRMMRLARFMAAALLWLLCLAYTVGMLLIVGWKRGSLSRNLDQTGRSGNHASGGDRGFRGDRDSNEDANDAEGTGSAGRATT
ncbi:hypothetical protein BJ684DRAFT_16292 [Piptocephalis cylindrospora]|uniref:Uncharacterized protein n=1 Tax=Piptocephalis cylindrospora TaxID=1907219 RepID=A0A4P9Y2Z7_9FUNG|nr:hypothetical protein BJ684DRAFT_16292 [Piptocephalis cylindrospora]|eukprot:RKP13296.1 hypothetical protein BJ684DRAFT_16292 [Piptocephalis cylindrospora]